MFWLSLILVAAATACIAFGIVLALNLGGAADRFAARHRELGNTHSFTWPRSNEVHGYRPQTTPGMRRAGGLFAFVGVVLLVLASVFASFPAL